jgi:hypothetical protein
VSSTQVPEKFVGDTVDEWGRPCSGAVWHRPAGAVNKQPRITKSTGCTDSSVFLIYAPSSTGVQQPSARSHGLLAASRRVGQRRLRGRRDTRAHPGWRTASRRASRPGTGRAARPW